MLLSNKYLKVSKLLVCLLLFKSTVSQNLIQNGSFENYFNINCGGGGFDNATIFPVSHVVDDWYTFNSPDYFNSICTNGPLPNQYGYDVPANFFGYSQAKNANAYAGIGTFPNTGAYTEYIYQTLNNPLQAGKIYCLSFYVSRADRKEYALKNIGAYFSASTPTLVSGDYISSIPQVINQNGFLTDTTQWVQIQGCFTAQGGEQYMTIGNFNSNANTDTLYVGSNNPIPNDPKYAYYYIDDITLTEQTTVGFDKLNNENAIRVYPNPAKDVLNIDIRNSNKENLKIKITDVLGKEIINEPYRAQIDVSFLEKGIYFLSVYDSNHLLTTKKVIKE